eukprot:TRINITY_DN12893_c0_g1_i1.p1 TRINITY_DN12893_c0_g1~~TRINITY_DN12893_c0_g1_i1.p1  ORF type:complete len:461 (+),score=75.86 TRINITY_DN12893_c0_g1_i1:37-1419(+)
MSSDAQSAAIPEADIMQQSLDRTTASGDREAEVAAAAAAADTSALASQSLDRTTTSADQEAEVAAATDTSAVASRSLDRTTTSGDREGEVAASEETSFLESYDLGDMLSQSTFAVVRHASHKLTGEGIAVKVFQHSEDNEKRLRVSKEVSIQQGLYHPNIVRFREVFQEPDYQYIVMDAWDGGDLFDLLTRERRFSEKRTAAYMQQILNGISYLHEMQICHRDTKPENIVCKTRGAAEDVLLQLIDFSVARRFEIGEYLTTMVGSIYYVAPEIIKNRYTPACDLWSCGVIQYMLLCGYPPFRGNTDHDILVRVCRSVVKFPDRYFRGVSEDAKDFTRALLNTDVKKRYTADQALESTWITSNAPPRPPTLVMSVSSSDRVPALEAGKTSSQLALCMHTISGDLVRLSVDEDASVGYVTYLVGAARGVDSGQRVRIIGSSGKLLQETECIGDALVADVEIP